MKTIISQGQGIIHLKDSCSFLKQQQTEVRYITGWLPVGISPRFVNFLGSLLGKKDLYKRLMVRFPANMERKEIVACALPEFFYWFMIIASRLHLIDQDKAITIGWKYWGHYTKRHIHDADIFHVRSGAGQGHAILHARKENMCVIVDHSIAHPFAMKTLLEKEYAKFGLSFDLDPESRFWSMVMKDCTDADYVLVNSDFVKQTFLSCGFPEEKIKVAYLGVREDFIGIKQDWAIDLSKPVHLLFLGSFQLRKGAHLLIEAIQLLNEKGHRVVLDVLSGADDLKVLKEEYNIPANIVFHAAVLHDQVRDHLSKSDLFVFPTFAEGSSRAAMEAMAAGLPVITTRNCGVPIIDKESGILIPEGNVHALVSAIEELIADQSLREQLGKNATTLIQENYTWHHYAKHVKTIYAECMRLKNTH